MGATASVALGGVMFRPIIALIIVGIGFVAGYIVRASISRKRRALAREEWLIRREQQRHDDGIESSSPKGIVFSVSDEAFEAAADKLAKWQQAHAQKLP